MWVEDRLRSDFQSTSRRDEVAERLEQQPAEQALSSIFTTSTRSKLPER